MALTPAVTELCENPNDVFFDVCKLLLSYADNILRDPNVEKYRSIHIGSPTFSSKLLPFSGAVECLFEMGFEESDTHLVFSKSASLEQLKVIRESIAAQRDQRLDAGQQVHLLAEAAAESPTSSKQAVSSLPVQPSSQTCINLVALHTIRTHEVALTLKKVGDPCVTCTPRNLNVETFSTQTPHICSGEEVGSKNFSGTLQSNFQHVLLYENPELQQKARSCIPHKQLLYAAKQKLKLAQEAETECELGEEDFLVLELLRWFKHDFFSWVDCLPCNNCGGSTQNSGSLSPTIDDLRWGAQRVENHYCQSCQLCTRFPRYNNPEQLLKTRRGRCGEWANCFTLCCRALCLEARYIWDNTDHVWTEVYSVSQRRWLHCDPCENICDKPLLYEVGWGKKLSYILAFSRDQVVDVTWRYSCKHPEVLSRRTNVQETWLLHTIIGLNALRQQSLGVDRKLELAERLLVELVEFISPKIPKQGELGGRTSGSLGWRQARGETGDADSGTIKQGTGYVFTPTEKERRDKLIHVLYNITKDQYCRISNDFEIIHCWDRCAWNRKSVFRKVENDWQMVYIARIEGSSVGQISWKFDFGPAKLSVKSVSIRASSQTFNLGEVSWLLQSGMITTEFSGDGSMQSIQCLNSSSEFTVTAQLRGGEGNASWQHAQLFRQSLRDTEESPFEIIIHLENT